MGFAKASDKGKAVRTLIRVSALFLFLCLFGCAEKKPALTLMVYLCGSNLESEAGAASADLDEMISALQENRSLELYVMAGGSKVWHTEGIDPLSADICHLTSKGLSPAGQGTSGSMGDPETLKLLLEYGYAHGSGEHIGLLLWDHGAGPLAGLCYDERFDQNKEEGYLSLEELSRALMESSFGKEKRKLDFIGMDACLMAGMETAAALEPYADYLFASQEMEPASGWDYSFLKEIAPGMTVEKIAETAGEKYLLSGENSLRDYTFSCIDLEKTMRLSEAMGEVFGKVEPSRENYEQITQARVNTRTVGHRSLFPYDLIDLGGFLEELEMHGQDTKQLKDCLQAAVPLSYSNHKGYSGLSMYYPFYNKTSFISPWSGIYEKTNVSEGIHSWIRSASNLWLSEPLMEWNSPGEITASESGTLMLELSKEEASSLASVQLVVVDENVPGQYYRSYLKEDIPFGQNGSILYEYRNESLYFTDETGSPVSSALFYWQMDDAIAIPAMVYNNEASVSAGKPLAPKGYYPDGTQMPFLLVYGWDENGALTLIDLLEYDPEGMLYGKSTLRLEDWDRVQMSSNGKLPAYDGEGRLLPFSAWENSTGWTGWEFDVEELGSPVFLSRMDDSRRFAFFELTDLQGNTYATAWTELNNPYREEIRVSDPLLMDQEDCRIELISITAKQAADPGLSLVLSVKKQKEDHQVLWIRRFEADGRALGEDLDFWVSLTPGQKEYKEIRIPADSLRKAGISRIEELSFELSVQEMFHDDRYSAKERVTIPLRGDLRGILQEEKDSLP